MLINRIYHMNIFSIMRLLCVRLFYWTLIFSIATIHSFQQMKNFINFRLELPKILFIFAQSGLLPLHRFSLEF